MNLPNKLTLFRIILVPIMVIVSFFDIPGSFLGIPTTMWILNLIFIIASITDKLDGYLARKNNQVTTFGKFLDPIADKILVVTAMILLVEMGRLPAWIPIIVIFREFVVSGYRLIAVQSEGKVIAANIWGKLKTVTQMLGIICMFLTNHPYFAFVLRAKTEEEMLVNSALTYMSTGDFIMNIIASILITISVIATVFSGYEYLKGGKDLLKDC
ncbi:MAG: CDP-diacylglycerol--glycerol-3-phosphate 3-phosphatidyltransferase [Clostridia bacterium]